MSKITHKKDEQGQAIIIVVFAVIVLLAFAGLAIDGGTLYLNRRRMQNAADSGSMAGTRLLAEAVCGDSTIDDLAIAREVHTYAESNGVDDTNGVPGDEVNGNVRAEYVQFENDAVVPFDPPDIVGDGGPIPVGASGVSVTTQIVRDTYLLVLVGQDQGSAGGDATAITGPPLAAGGLRPIGIPLDVLENLEPGDAFLISMSNNCDSGGCLVEYSGLTSAHRGWVNPGYVWNCTEGPANFPRARDEYRLISANVLMQLMSNPLQTMFYSDCLWEDGCRCGDYMHTTVGINMGVLNQECGPLLGKTIYTPVFDQFVESFADIPGIQGVDKPNNPPPPGYQFFYHIIGFTGVQITSCQAPGIINMELVKVIAGEGQVFPQDGTGYSESGACMFNTQVVTLWE
jgi:hypothetical protein